jgi:5-methylcytosine-specific restriction endonuclease McrA
MFPRLRETRFANSADFYTLFLIVRDLDREGCILTERRRNEQAQRLLIWLSNGVDTVRDRVRNAQGARPDERLFADYLMTVRADADSRATRARRAEILRSLFGTLFSKKDKQRGFTPEQRRLIWHSDEKKKCPGCDDVLSWENFTIDHIKAHSLGGPSSIPNSRLMCLSCNAKRGTGRRSRARGDRRGVR